ncbi:helix-turn-helix domain-containing protein [Zhongshania sp.]|uniref:helix-turn-helix transcriptional regulator n=1 Tax=Zhongshania sp. TaxID=1971902 RepID=UPI001B750854|nr:helix-turn-helix domain-containing protein [Zhongshania sp.]MBQ0797557.1 helix-turn-helix domain-containing protein [Zhongshania sp.]
MSDTQTSQDLHLLNTKDAAAFLGTHFRTLENWRVNGVGPSYFKLGRSVRYGKAELESWVKSNSRHHSGAAAAA